MFWCFVGGGGGLDARPRRVSINSTNLYKFLCGCFAGAWEWEHLQEALEEKLKNSLAVAQLMERIRSLIGKERVITSSPSHPTVVTSTRVPGGLLHQITHIIMS